MKLEKYVLIVDQEAGPLARLSPRLRELDFRVVRVPDATAAIEFVRAFPKLSMVAVRDHLDVEESRELLAGIREAQPDLPLLWHGARDSLPPGESAEVLPFESVTAGDLLACAERLLCQHLYPPELRAFLAETSLSAFSCFAAHATSVEPFLKANRARLAELSAVIAFAGTETTGHVVVSAARAVVSGAYKRLFGDRSPPGDDALVDVLGECGNHIVGGVAAYFEKRGHPVNFGVPLYVAGADCMLWQGAHRPSVVVELETVNGRLFSELCITTFETATARSRFADEVSPSGQCVVL